VRNLGKPVALAQRYYFEGADEVVFLNITSFRQVHYPRHCREPSGIMMMMMLVMMMMMHCSRASIVVVYTIHLGKPVALTTAVLLRGRGRSGLPQSPPSDRSVDHVIVRSHPVYLSW
jgi:hypothetical protein